MTNEEILQKAISKALNNKFELMIPLIATYALELSEDEVIRAILSYHKPYEIIFSHSFAKAFWGEEVASKYELEQVAENQKMGNIYHYRPKRWALHLQQMVLEEDPITYLQKFL